MKNMKSVATTALAVQVPAKKTFYDESHEIVATTALAVQVPAL